MVKKICHLTVGVFGKEFQDVLDHCLDLEDAVGFDILEQKFEYDELSNDQGIRDIADKCDQLYRVLSSLTTGGSEDLVVGCANLKASISSEEADSIADLSCQMCAVDVMEIYSPKRFTDTAKAFELRPGFSVVDLTEQKPDGSYWDLNKSEDVKEVEETIDREEPKLLTGSPPCHMFSQLQNISWHKLSPEIREKRMSEALHHLHVSCKMYRKLNDSGRWFLHEAPWGAASWKDPAVQAILALPGVYLVKGPMCRWEMKATDRRGLASLLKGECTNQHGKDWHRHIHLIGGIARQAAQYPPKLVRAVLKCLRQQLTESGELSSAEANVSGPVPEEPFIDPQQFEEWYWDDVHGGWLDPEKVKEARQLEMEYLKRQAVYEKRPISEALKVTGRRPIPVRWLDTGRSNET